MTNEVSNMSHHKYDPNRLVDSLLSRLALKNDAALAKVLEVAPPVLSKIRHHRMPVSGSMLIRIHEITAMPLQELREIMGDRRAKYRISGLQWMPKKSSADRAS